MLPDTIAANHHSNLHYLLPGLPVQSHFATHWERLLGTAKPPIRPTDVMRGEPLAFLLMRTLLESRANCHTSSKDTVSRIGELWDLAWKTWKEECRMDRPESVHRYGWGMWLLIGDHQANPLVTLDQSAGGPGVSTPGWIKRLQRLDQALDKTGISISERWALRWDVARAEVERPIPAEHAKIQSAHAGYAPGHNRERHFSAGLLQAIRGAWVNREDRQALLAIGPDGRRMLWNIFEGIAAGQDQHLWQAWADVTAPVNKRCTYARQRGGLPLDLTDLVVDSGADRAAANLLAETLARGGEAAFGSREALMATIARFPWDPQRAALTFQRLEDAPDAQVLVAQLRQAQLKETSVEHARTRPRPRS